MQRKGQYLVMVFLKVLGSKCLRIEFCCFYVEGQVSLVLFFIEVCQAFGSLIRFQTQVRFWRGCCCFGFSFFLVFSFDVYIQEIFFFYVTGRQIVCVEKEKLFSMFVFIFRLQVFGMFWLCWEVGKVIRFNYLFLFSYFQVI